MITVATVDMFFFFSKEKYVYSEIVKKNVCAVKDKLVIPNLLWCKISRIYLEQP